MASLSRSTVCKWHFAFEHCGLLKVVKRSRGGSRKTTERAFDLDLLKRIAWSKSGGKETPPEWRLVEATIERPTARPNGEMKMVRVPVFNVVLFAEDCEKPSDLNGHVSTVRRAEGSDTGNRPSRRRVRPWRGRSTVRPPEANRPAGGPKPSENHQGEPPHTPGRANAFASSRDPMIEDLRRWMPQHADVIDAFVDPLWRALRKSRDQVDPNEFLKILAEGIAAEGFDRATLEAGCEMLRKSRSVMPTLAQCLNTLATCRAQAPMPTATAPTAGGPHSLAAHTQTFLSGLAGRIGDEAFMIWFKDLVIERVDEGARAVLVSGLSPAGWRRAEDKYQRAFVAQAREQFGDEYGVQQYFGKHETADE